MMARDGGRIELICGPMFAGKTTELIRRLAAARAAGRRVVALQPVSDTRSGPGRLMTHGGVTIDARPVGGVAALADAVGDAEVAGIDEAHFYPAELADACCRLAEQGVRVIAAGVDRDHRGAWFPALAALARCADEQATLTARCVRCGGVAEFTQRLVASDAPIVVGGAEAYEPRCGGCFQPPVRD